MSEIKVIRAKMSELDNISWDKHPEAKLEYNELKNQLQTLEQLPEETIGMKRLKEISPDKQRKAYEKNAVPRIEDAKKGDGNPNYVKHWKDMTYDKWIEESADHFLEEDMLELMKDMPRTHSVFQSFAGWMSFRGKCVGNSEILSHELKDKAYSDMEPNEMLLYANQLEKYILDFKKDHKIPKSQKEDYQVILSAIIWLRFWAEKGHGMYAWY